MGTRKYLAGLCLAGALTLTGSAAAFAAGTKTTTTPSNTASVSPVTVKTLGSKYYLYDTITGKKITGYKGVTEYPASSGKYYYFKTAKGRILVNTLIKKSGNFYYAAENGQLASGFQKAGNYNYYFSPKTHAAVKGGWKRVSVKYYYFNTKGIQLTGLQTIKKKVYFLNPKDGGARAVGWTKVNKKWQYFNAKGKRLTGLITDPATNTKYLINKTTATPVTGLQKIGTSYYYFDKSEGYTSSGKKVGGAMVTGWQKIGTKTYYFATTGKAITGWLTKGNSKYYFNSNGVMQTGTITIGNKKYTFDSNSGALKSTETITGAYSIKINQNTNVVTIYRGTTPVKAMLCSVGLGGATPNGTFTLSNKRHWQPLFGNCWGQYTSTITGNILFHSVYYLRYRDPHSLATAEFRKLGSAASHGCVRLNCADAYYIYTNCPVGTKVTIFRGTSNDDPLGKPYNQYANWTGNYDPTDPIPND